MGRAALAEHGSTSGPVLVRGRADAADQPHVLDAGQQAVVDHRPGAGPLVVLGAPGTGRTTALVALLAARVERDGADPASLLVLAPSRTAAGTLRDRLSARLGTTSSGSLARTPSAYAFGVLRRAALLADAPLPRLLSGPEQDHLIADLLRGHESGDAPAPPWPAGVPRETRVLRAFRAELRDLMMRAMERETGPEGLAALGRRAGRPEWVAVAHVLREYREVMALASPGAHDPAAVLVDAARALEADPDLLAAERARLSLVAVEDHHESTSATARLLDLLAGPSSAPGPDLVLVGDPDATTAGFRGGNPALLAGASQRHRRADGSEAPTVVLGTRWRAGAALSGPAAALAARIGSVGAVAHRRPAPSPVAGPGSLETHVLRSAGAQGAFVAGLLREEHLQHGTAWGAMAVVVRSTRATRELRRALARAGVPVAVPVAEVPVREESAVRPLRTAMHLVLQHRGAPEAAGAPGAATPAGPVLGEALPDPGGDVDAVLADADVTTAPVLLGWSYGGLVACDWLSRGGRAAGLVLVGAITGIGRGNPGGRVGPAMRAALPDALSVDPAVAVPALTGFTSAMTRDGARAQALLGQSLATPPRVRAALFDRTTGHAGTLAAYDGAALVLHGTADAVVDPRAGEHAAATIPGASASWWDGAGHAPFLEHPSRFVAEVAALVAQAGTQAAG